MSSSPENKDELQPLRRSSRKSVVAKTEEVVVTPRKRKSTATPLKNVPEKAEVVGTPRRTRAAATPKKVQADNLSTPKKHASTALSEETPKKKQAKSSPKNTNGVNNSPPISKRTPRKSRAREDLQKTADAQEIEEKSSGIADEELNSNRRGRRKSTVTIAGKKNNEKSVEMTIEENIKESESSHKIEESANQKQDFEDVKPISNISSRKKSRKSVHFKSDVDEHQIESDDSPPSNQGSNEIHILSGEEGTCKSSLALVPKVVLHDIKQDIREANPAEMLVEGSNTVNTPNDLADAVCIADVPENIENYSAMHLDKTLLSPKNFLNSDEEESDSGITTKVTNHIKNKLTENISKTEDEGNFKSPRRKLSYEHKNNIENDVIDSKEENCIQLENPTDRVAISNEKSESSCSPQKENIPEVIHEKVSILDVSLKSIKDENTILSPKKTCEHVSPDKVTVNLACREDSESSKQMDETSSSDNDTKVDEKVIINHIEENSCNTSVIISSSVSPRKDCLEATDSGDLNPTDSLKTDLTAPPETAEDNPIKTSVSSDHSISEVETTMSAKTMDDKVIVNSQAPGSNSAVDEEVQTPVVTDLEITQIESTLVENQEQENIDRINGSSDNLNVECEVAENEILLDNKNDIDSSKPSETSVDKISSNETDSFEQGIINLLNSVEFPEKITCPKSEYRSDDKIEDAITDQSAKSPEDSSDEVKPTQEDLEVDRSCYKVQEGQDLNEVNKLENEKEKNSEYVSEGAITESDKNDTTAKEEQIKCNDLDLSILDKEELQSNCLLENSVEQSQCCHSDTSSDNKTDIKSMHNEDENDIICQNQSSVAVKVSYFEKLEKSFEKDRTILKRKDKSDKCNDSISSLSNQDMSLNESNESEKSICDKHSYSSEITTSHEHLQDQQQLDNVNVGTITSCNNVSDINQPTNDRKSISDKEDDKNEIFEEIEVVNDLSEKKMSELFEKSPIEHCVPQNTENEHKGNSSYQSMAEKILGNNSFEKNKPAQIPICSENQKTESSELSVNGVSVVEGRSEENGIDNANESSSINESIATSDNLEQSVLEPCLSECKIKADNEICNPDTNASTSTPPQSRDIQVPDKIIDSNEPLNGNVGSNGENTKQPSVEIPEATEAESHKDQLLGLDILVKSTDELLKETNEKRELSNQADHPKDFNEHILEKSNPKPEEIKLGENTEENDLSQKLSREVDEKESIPKTNREQCGDNITLPENNCFVGLIPRGKPEDSSNSLCEEKDDVENEISCQNESECQSELCLNGENITDANVKLGEENSNLLNKINIESTKSVSVESERIHTDKNKMLDERNGETEALTNKSNLFNASGSTSEDGSSEGNANNNSSDESKCRLSNLRESKDKVFKSEEKNEQSEIHYPSITSDDNKVKGCDSEKLSPAQQAGVSKTVVDTHQDKSNRVHIESSGASRLAYEIPNCDIKSKNSKLTDENITKLPEEKCIKKDEVKECLPTEEKKSKELKIKENKIEPQTKSRSFKEEKQGSKIPLLEKNINKVSSLSTNSSDGLNDKELSDQKDAPVSEILGSNQSDLHLKEKQSISVPEIKQESKIKATGLLGKRPANKDDTIKTKTLPKQEKKVNESGKKTEPKKDRELKHVSKPPAKVNSVVENKENKLLGKRPFANSGDVSDKKNKTDEENRRKESHSALEDKSKKENNGTVSVSYFFDLEAEEVAKAESESSSEEISSDSASEKSVKSGFDFLDCEAKEEKKECHINAVESLFNSTVVASCNESDEEDIDWLPPSKKTYKDKTKDRQVKRKVSSKTRESSRLRGKQNKISAEEASGVSVVSTKQGLFTVSVDQDTIAQPHKQDSDNVVIDTKHSTFSVTNICEASSSKTQNTVPTGFVVLEPSDQSSSMPTNLSPSNTDDTRCYGTAVLPDRLKKKDIIKAFEEVGINDIISIEYTGAKVVLIEFSNDKSLKRALKFYGQIHHNNEPIYVLAGKDSL